MLPFQSQKELVQVMAITSAMCNNCKKPSKKTGRGELAFFAAAFVCLAAGVSQAADVAFYSFTEGNDGEDAVGVALRNAVDASSLSGSVSRNNGMDADLSTAPFFAIRSPP